MSMQRHDVVSTLIRRCLNVASQLGTDVEIFTYVSLVDWRLIFKEWRWLLPLVVRRSDHLFFQGCTEGVTKQQFLFIRNGWKWPLCYARNRGHRSTCVSRKYDQDLLDYNIHWIFKRATNIRIPPHECICRGWSWLSVPDCGSRLISMRWSIVHWRCAILKKNAEKNKLFYYANPVFFTLEWLINKYCVPNLVCQYLLLTLLYLAKPHCVYPKYLSRRVWA